MSDHDDEYLAKRALRAADLTYAVPRVPFSGAGQVVVSERPGAQRAVKIFKVAGGIRMKSAAIIEDERLASPGGIPVFLRVAVKDL